MQRFNGKPKNKQELWRHYKLGIPSFVPVLKRRAIEECNDGICALLENNDGLRAQYPDRLPWPIALDLAVLSGLVSPAARDTSIELARSRNMIKVEEVGNA